MPDATALMLANRIIHAIGDAGFTVLVWRSHTDPEWVELRVLDGESGEMWIVEGDELYPAVVELAGQIGFDLE